MKMLYKYTPELIVVLYLFIFMGFRSPERNWDRIINSDGKGYYAYLPAIFIYNDLQFKFVEGYEYQYYPENRSAFKEFRNQAGDRKINKYFPGLAVLWLPFFLFGHAMAWLEIFPRDGYSLPYQYSILLSAFIFMWMGARWLMRLLQKSGSDDKTASFITFVIALGTNLLFFTIIEPSMTHVYSFALITGFCYFIFKLFREYESRSLVKSMLFLTLIFLIRPTNILILLLVPFFAGDRENIRMTLAKIRADRAALIRGGVQVFLLLLVPVVLWYLQTGKPFVYSYGTEKLNFLKPHFLSILFSYDRGWMLYTPIAFVSLFGFIGLFKADRKKALWLALFLVIFIYVASCWWVWNYASKCGQRTFIDLYVVVALLLLALFRSLPRLLYKRILSVLLVIMIGLNLMQFYQHAKWIFPPYNITGEIYWDSFLRFNQEARVYIPHDAVSKTLTVTNDMEQNQGPAWMNDRTRNDTLFHQGKWSSKADRVIPYSVGLETSLDTLFTTKNRIIKVEAFLLTPKEVTEATLVIDYQSSGKSVSYNQFILGKFVRTGAWTKIAVAFYVPVNLPAGSSAKIYFFNPSALYKLYVDDLRIDFISLKDDPAYRKIEGVLLPVAIADN